METLINQYKTMADSFESHYSIIIWGEQFSLRMTHIAASNFLNKIKNRLNAEY